MNASPPSQQLKAGADILLKFLGPIGFAFVFRDAAVGSGGAFAWGEFIRKDRRLEVHFRHSLGEVQYRKLPRQVDIPELESAAVVSLGMNCLGGSPPRAS